MCGWGLGESCDGARRGVTAEVRGEAGTTGLGQNVGPVVPVDSSVGRDLDEVNRNSGVGVLAKC